MASLTTLFSDAACQASFHFFVRTPHLRFRSGTRTPVQRDKNQPRQRSLNFQHHHRITASFGRHLQFAFHLVECHFECCDIRSNLQFQASPLQQFHRPSKLSLGGLNLPHAYKRGPHSIPCCTKSWETSGFH